MLQTEDFVLELSKSDYMLFLRHPAWLWLKRNDPTKLPGIPPSAQHRVDEGYEFEEFAEQLFSSAKKIGFKDVGEYNTMLSRTSGAWSSGAHCVIQGKYQFGEITCITDILEDDGDGYVLTEIKSSSSAKPEHELDLAFQRVVLEGGGDYPANEYIIGSGHNALLCRYQSEKRILSNKDQLSIEWAGTYKHYHSAMFRTIPIGKVDLKHVKMHESCLEALINCEKKLIPGNAVGDVFDMHARTFDNNGYKKARMNACGYSLGSTFSPNWMDWPMLYTGNPYKIVPGNVFFMHMILMDSDNGIAMNLGETYLVTENGNERLGKQKLDLVIF